MQFNSAIKMSRCNDLAMFLAAIYATMQCNASFVNMSYALSKR